MGGIRRGLFPEERPLLGPAVGARRNGRGIPEGCRLSTLRSWTFPKLRPHVLDVGAVDGPD
eukprot:10259825-Heterocapsa_arctica.AAC.1